MKVWKFLLPQMNSIKDSQFQFEVDMPEGSKPLHVAMQGDGFYLWALCDPEADKEAVKMFCVGTGFGSVPGGSIYIGTVSQGMYVWHIFREG